MTIHLPEDLERFIQGEVLAGRYSSETELVTEAIRQLQMARQRHSVSPSAPTSVARKPIWQVAEELGRSILAADVQTLPNDGAAQHDHYVYGSPRHTAP